MILLPDGERAFPVEPGARYGADVQARRRWNHLSTCPGFARLRPVDGLAGGVAAAPASGGRARRVRELRAALAGCR
jgi:hypothetical protein